MSRSLYPLIVTVIWLIVAGGLGFAYGTDRIGFGAMVFLGILILVLGVVAVIFLRKMSHPPESVEQVLYNTEHPTRK